MASRASRGGAAWGRVGGWVLRIIPLLAFVGLVVAGCGRSDLDELPLADGGADRTPDVYGPGECNATTCPAGCCDGNTCRPGDELTACGGFGRACTDCVSVGFERCDAALHACANEADHCDVTNCAGCCEGTTCVFGVDDNACGGSGEMCAHCAVRGQVCEGRTCVDPRCGPHNCKGCCFGDQCLTGTDAFACGAGGELCQNCAAGGGRCGAAPGGGGVCEGTTTCGPKSCPGCCAGTICQTGKSNSACGVGGSACADCASAGAVCNGATCVSPKCSPANCTGCCDAFGECRLGYLSTACGQNGASCVDCTALKKVCDVGANPRVCADATSCPVAYPSCPPGVSTGTPSIQHVCSDSDLANAAAACAGGAHAAGCDSFMAGVNASCAACLRPFVADFAELQGIYRCVAPFVSAVCRRATGCETDCEEKSCEPCPASSVAQCRANTRLGQCSSYVLQSACVVSAFGGAGAFCNPANYDNVGEWLQGVGGHYCGP